MLLLLLLFALIGLLEIMQPGIFNARWTSNTIRFAIPLAMLAACQTLTMLTGGIDLSAGTVATITAFAAATLSPLIGVPAAVAVGLSVALLVALVNGFGVAICRVHPPIMTLGTGLIANGCLLVHRPGGDRLIALNDEPGHQALCDAEQVLFLRAIAPDIDLTRPLQDAVPSLRICLAADASIRSGQVEHL